MRTDDELAAADRAFRGQGRLTGPGQRWRWCFDEATQVFFDPETRAPLAGEKLASEIAWTERVLKGLRAQEAGA